VHYLYFWLSIRGFITAGPANLLVCWQKYATLMAVSKTSNSTPLSSPQDSPEFIDSYTTNANNNDIVLAGYCGAESCTPTAVPTP
jgi:hypothetical protein